MQTPLDTSLAPRIETIKQVISQLDDEAIERVARVTVRDVCCEERKRKESQLNIEHQEFSRHLYSQTDQLIALLKQLRSEQAQAQNSERLPTARKHPA